MSRPTLSLCIATRSDAPRVHALLSSLREHVDEIVLSVDAKGDLGTLEACADLADRRFVHELDRNPNWLAAWLQHQCSSDWILRLDDDELPSADLLSALPELIADRYPTVYRIPRRWLVSPDSYVAGLPWELEALGRLVRNIPGLWHMDGKVHSEPLWEGEIRLLDEPIYHLDTLLVPLEERREKVRRYERLGGGGVIEGVGVNRFYLPEEWRLDTAPVPVADVEAIGRLLEPGAPPPSATSGSPVERVGAEAAARFNRRPVAAGSRSGSLEPLTARERCPAASRCYLRIEVENSGEDPWWRMLPFQPPSVAVLARWLDRDGSEIASGGASALPSTLFPGRRAQTLIAVEAPALEGPFLLELQLADGATERFGAPVTIPLTIDPARPGPPDTVDPATARELALRERERAADRRERAADAFARTRRYRFAAALGRPLDWARAALRRESRG